MFEELDAAFKDVEEVPSNLELLYYMFFDKGIGLKEFNTYPIPYILGIMRTNKYIKDKEKESLKSKNG